MGNRAIVYTRISHDATGEGLGVARQEDACRALCEARGWSVVDVEVENDTSATRGRRPVWDRVVARLGAGEADYLVAWALDRITRSPLELERLLDLVEPLGVQIATVSGDMALTTADGRMVARLLASVARAEVDYA